jgi:hypothetical protein
MSSLEKVLLGRAAVGDRIHIPVFRDPFPLPFPFPDPDASPVAIAGVWGGETVESAPVSEYLSDEADMEALEPMTEVRMNELVPVH